MGPRPSPKGLGHCGHSLSKLWVIPASDHSLCAAPNPRLINRRNPCPSLTCPNTGSTSTPRFLYRARPRFVSSLRSILSLGLSPFGIRPRRHPFSRSIFRCFQSLGGGNKKLRHLWPGASPDVGLTPVPGIGQARFGPVLYAGCLPEYAPWFGASAPVAAHRWPLGSLQRLL